MRGTRCSGPTGRIAGRASGAGIITVSLLGRLRCLAPKGHGSFFVSPNIRSSWKQKQGYLSMNIKLRRYLCVRAL